MQLHSYGIYLNSSIFKNFKYVYVQAARLARYCLLSRGVAQGFADHGLLAATQGCEHE